MSIQKANYIQAITPLLGFDSEAEEAMNFYISGFKNSKVCEPYPMKEGQDRRDR